MSACLLSMTELRISGHTVLVDEADLPLVTGEVWWVSSHGYVCSSRRLGRNTQYLHRVLMSAGAGQLVDHINGNGLDNRRCNLRLCTKAQNNCNRVTARNNTSGVKGVSWHKAAGKWSAYVELGGKRTYLGLFTSLEHATAVVTAARLNLHAEFACDGVRK